MTFLNGEMTELGPKHVSQLQAREPLRLLVLAKLTAEGEIDGDKVFIIKH